MNEKYFIITVDTEGDNLWKHYEGKEITTKNTQFIPRFQQLCKKYGFKPVYLTNYEMITDPEFVNFAKEALRNDECEIGIHIHAWNNPPLFEIPEAKGSNSYLIEYPSDIMRAKFETTYNLIKDKVGVAPVTHRAGRWVMNREYFSLLEDFNIRVDCSYTPTIDWSKTVGALAFGCDYSKVPEVAHNVGKILEVPMTIKTKRKFEFHGIRTFIRNVLRGNIYPVRNIWLRPAISQLSEMKWLIDSNMKNPKINYVEFMVHSSELMPEGSPYFQTKDSIEELYKIMEELFEYVYNRGYTGVTLDQYCKRLSK